MRESILTGIQLLNNFGICLNVNQSSIVMNSSVCVCVFFSFGKPVIFLNIYCLMYVVQCEVYQHLKLYQPMAGDVDGFY